MKPCTIGCLARKSTIGGTRKPTEIVWFCIVSRNCCGSNLESRTSSDCARKLYAMRTVMP